MEKNNVFEIDESLDIEYGFEDMVMIDPMEISEYFDKKVVGRGNVYALVHSEEYNRTIAAKLTYNPAQPS